MDPSPSIRAHIPLLNTPRKSDSSCRFSDRRASIRRYSTDDVATSICARKSTAPMPLLAGCQSSSQNVTCPAGSRESLTARTTCVRKHEQPTQRTTKNVTSMTCVHFAPASERILPPRHATASIPTKAHTPNGSHKQGSYRHRHTEESSQSLTLDMQQTDTWSRPQACHPS